MRYVISFTLVALLRFPMACGDATVPPTIEYPNGLLIEPVELSFGTVPHETRSTLRAELTNKGASTITVDRIRIDGHPGFTIAIGDTTYSNTHENASLELPLAMPLTLLPDDVNEVLVTYAPIAPEPAHGSIKFLALAPNESVAAELMFSANIAAPCISRNPSRVVFGGANTDQSSTISLEILSCNDVDLIIHKVELRDNPDQLFRIDTARIGPFPITVQAFSSIHVDVTYSPELLTALEPDGARLGVSQIHISSNAYYSDIDINVEAFASFPCTPTAHITVQEGDEVLPHTVLHLSGRDSVSANGPITDWEWSVLSPQGSASTFSPSAFVAETTYPVNIAGEYVFRLNVRDLFGDVSCVPAEYPVTVALDDAIHIELQWQTPGDINESNSNTDEVGGPSAPDLDLHLLHPNASGQYFDPVYDCYWDNPNPEWGLPTPDDNPRLDLGDGDTNRAGPENLNIATPEQGVRYRVGVHYRNNAGFADAFATLRVYVYGILQAQWSDVRLATNELWDAYYIDWPSGEVTPIGVDPQINHVPPP